MQTLSSLSDAFVRHIKESETIELFHVCKRKVTHSTRLYSTVSIVALHCSSQMVMSDLNAFHLNAFSHDKRKKKEKKYNRL